jgi:hypothetical protein
MDLKQLANDFEVYARHGVRFDLCFGAYGLLVEGRRKGIEGRMAVDAKLVCWDNIHACSSLVTIVRMHSSTIAAQLDRLTK